VGLEETWRTVTCSNVSMPASNGNDESPTTNTITYNVLYSLSGVSTVVSKSLWGCYLWRRCKHAGMKTMARQETFSRHQEDPTMLCCCDWWHD
jgi:hypothetical protein